jgi:hypothetical protein
MLVILAGFAFLELKEFASGSKYLKLPSWIAIPLVILAIGVSGATLSPKEFFEALLGAGGILLLLLTCRWLYFVITTQVGIDQGTIIAATVAGMISTCQKAFLLILLWFLLGTLFYLPSIVRKKIHRKTPVVLIPFLVIAVVVVEQPYPKAAVDYYWNLQYTRQLKSVESWILAVRSSTRSEPSFGVTQSGSAEPDANTKALLNRSYADTKPHLVFSILRSVVSKRFVFIDADKSLIFEVSGDKDDYYKVLAIRECWCVCGF